MAPLVASSCNARGAASPPVAMRHICRTTHNCDRDGHDNAYAASPAHELVKRSRPLKYSLYRVSSRASAPLVPPVKLAIPYFLVIGIWDSARRESAERLASETELL